MESLCTRFVFGKRPDGTRTVSGGQNKPVPVIREVPQAAEAGKEISRMHPIRPFATPAFRLAERQRHGPYRQRSSLLLHGPPDANRPPGWKPAACNRWASGALRSCAKRSLCDALPSVAMTMTGRACLAVRCDMHECPSQFVGQRSIRPSKANPTGDDVESQNEQFAQFIF